MLFAHRDRRLIFAIRDFQARRAQKGVLSRILYQWAKLRYSFWTLATSSDISREATLSADLRLPHPNGIIMHRTVTVAEGCLIMQQVTLGQTATGGGPRIGPGVYIGAGAKVLGEIEIGRGARIGANAVVLMDVPPYATAVGIPARIIERVGPDRT